MDIIKDIESTPALLTKIVEGWAQHQSPSFDELAQSVLQTHQTAQSGAIRAVNQMATLRNWLIGCYIVEYEQRGSDRAKYGERLLKRLEERVNTKGLNLDIIQEFSSFLLALSSNRQLVWNKSDVIGLFTDRRRTSGKKSDGVELF